MGLARKSSSSGLRSLTWRKTILLPVVFHYTLFSSSNCRLFLQHSPDSSLSVKEDPQYTLEQTQGKLYALLNCLCR